MVLNRFTFNIDQDFIVSLIFFIIFSLLTTVPMNQITQKLQNVRCCICLEDYVNYASWKPIHGLFTSRPPPPPPKDWQLNLIHTAVGCSHYVCCYCLKQYLHTYLNQPHDVYDRIECPQHGCKQTYIAQNIVEKVMPNRAAIDRWWIKVYEKTIMDSIGYCPYRDCRGVFELPHEVPEKESQPRFAKCVSCHRGLCMNCQNKWHPDTSCQSGCPDTATWQYSQKYHREREKKNLTRKNSFEARQLALSKDWTRCPKCKEMIEKSEGCNSVQCRCGTRFCFRCGSKAGATGCKKSCGRLNDKQLREFRQHMFLYGG